MSLWIKICANTSLGDAQLAAEAGADGVLLTDVIVEEAGEYLEQMHENKLAPVFLAAPTSPDVRLKAIAMASQGFVYAISRVGITGTQQKVAGDASELVARLRRFTALPIAVGFGISNAEHVKAVGEFARQLACASGGSRLNVEARRGDPVRPSRDLVVLQCIGVLQQHLNGHIPGGEPAARQVIHCERAILGGRWFDRRDLELRPSR